MSEISLKLSLMLYMVAYDALMHKCATATAHCTCTMAAMLTRETSELTGPEWAANRMALETSAVTMLLCYFAYFYESNRKIGLLHVLCTSVAVNMTKIVIKISQGSAVTQSVQGGLITGWAVAQTCCISQWPKYRKRGNFDHPWEQNP